MTIRQDLIEACQDDARRAGERNRMLLEARRARRQRPAPAASVRRLGHLLARRATALPRRFLALPEQTGQGPRKITAHDHHRAAMIMRTLEGGLERPALVYARKVPQDGTTRSSPSSASR